MPFFHQHPSVPLSGTTLGTEGLIQKEDIGDLFPSLERS